MFSKILDYLYPYTLPVHQDILKLVPKRFFEEGGGGRRYTSQPLDFTLLSTQEERRPEIGGQKWGQVLREVTSLSSLVESKPSWWQCWSNIVYDMGPTTLRPVHPRWEPIESSEKFHRKITQHLKILTFFWNQVYGSKIFIPNLYLHTGRNY